MYISLLLQPQQGAIQSINFKCGHKGGPILSMLTMLLTAIIGTIIWIEVTLNGSPVTLILGDWIVTSIYKIEWGLNFDSLTSSMQIPILYVGTMVQIYSQGYMGSDPHLPRFYSYLSLFVFMMLILVTGDNLLVLFVGWEGVGLASYLLINFWYTRIAANQAAMKAFLMNRIGDWSMTLGIQQAINQIGDISFESIQSLGQYINTDYIQIQTIQQFIGASAKSAQQGLHTWQANAMEGGLNRQYLKKLELTKENKIYNKNVKNFDITSYQKEAIIGLLQSDGYINEKNQRMEFTFKASYLVFIKWQKYNILGTICTDSEPTPYPKDKPTQYWFGTKKLNYFEEKRKEWYVPNKIIPISIKKDFTEVSLAFCQMGDGYWEKDSKTVFICTDNFTQEEVNMLLSILRNKFGLVVSTKKRKECFRIRFSSRGNNIKQLRSQVVPHFHESMLYKLGM